MRDHSIGNVFILSVLMEYFLWAVPFIGLLWYWRSTEHKFAYKLFVPLYILVAVFCALWDSLLEWHLFAVDVRAGGFWWNFIRELLVNLNK